MQNKTVFTKEEFGEILSEYDLGQYITSKPFSNGTVQTTLLLQTTKGNFVFRYYETRSQKHVLFEIDLLNYLKSKKYPCPAVYKNKHGKYLGEYRQKPFLIIEYIEGEACKNPNDFDQPEELSEIIKTVAKLHLLTENFQPNSLLDHEEYNSQYCLKTYKEKKLPKTKENSEKENWLKNKLSKLSFSENLPKGICHADLNHTNFLFRNHTLSGIVDFDMSQFTFFIYDLANLVYYWAWPPKAELSFKKMQFITDEYSKYRKLNKAELDNLSDALKLIVFLEICWSKEDEFEEGQKKIKFLNSMGEVSFH